MADIGRRSWLFSLGAASIGPGCAGPSPSPPSGQAKAPLPPEPPAPLDDGLERMTPAEAASRGVSLPALRELVAYEASRSDQLVVLADGKLLGRWVFSGDEGPLETMSATKSFVSLAVGLLVDRGKLSLDQPVSDFFAPFAEGPRAKVTVRHLMNHTSGIASGKTTEAIYASPDFVQHAVGSPLTSEPGSTFFYNNSATNLLAGLVGRAAGEPVDRLVGREIFSPLGIDRFEWLRDRAGNPHGMSGLRLRAVDMAKVGQMVADGGIWKGHRIVSEAWLAESTGKASQPLNARCGLLWWLEIDFRVTIDRPLLETLRRGGAPEGFVARLEPLVGHVYTRAEFFPALSGALGGKAGLDEWHANTWKKGLPDGTLVDSRVTSFAARGWLGQELHVMPSRRLVVARLRRSTAERRAASDRGEGGRDRLIELASEVRPG